MMRTQADQQLAERIRIATERSALSRNRYTEKVVREVTDSLAQAEDLVKRSILRYDQLGSLPDNKLKAKTGLEQLQADINETMRDLKKDQTLRLRRVTKEAFRNGILGGFKELVEARWPGFAKLKKDDTTSLANNAFTLIDRDALDFLANYTVVLAGDVQRELADGIKRTLLTAVTTGKGTADIVRDLGSVIKDPNAFRRAGGKLFQRAQYRMELIARTEVMRAFNQGRMKMHHEIGVQRLEWLASGDERVCPECGPLHERVFDIDQIPPIPYHPQCRCSVVVAEPIDLLKPEQIKQRSQNLKRKQRQAKRVFEHGTPSDFETLSFDQLSDLAKTNQISRSRTKKELLREVVARAPGTNTADLVGEALQAVLKRLEIGRKRSKQDLIRELLKKQRFLAKAKQEAEESRKNPQSKLREMTYQELKDLAKTRGISRYLSRQEVVEILNERNPSRNHTGLSSDELSRLMKQHGLGRHKTKALLIRSLEKLAGTELAESLLS